MDNCTLPNCYPASYDINEGFEDVFLNLEPQSYILSDKNKDYKDASAFSAEKAAKAQSCRMLNNKNKNLIEQDSDNYDNVSGKLEWENLEDNAIQSYPDTAPPLQRGNAKESADVLLKKCPLGYKDVKMGSACLSKDDFFFKDGYIDEGFENTQVVNQINIIFFFIKIVIGIVLLIIIFYYFSNIKY
jgi:hypothetical protein